MIVYLDIITFIRVSIVTVWGTGQVFIITESSLFRSARYLEIPIIILNVLSTAFKLTDEKA